MPQQPALKLPLKPTIGVNLSTEGISQIKRGLDGGLVAFCGWSGADIIDEHLCHLGGELVQVETVAKFHGWSARIQPGVMKLVLAWPIKPPRKWRLIGWMHNDRVRRFPIPHHQFLAFDPKQNDERSDPDHAVGASRPHIVRP